MSSCCECVQMPWRASCSCLWLNLTLVKLLIRPVRRDACQTLSYSANTAWHAVCCSYTWGFPSFSTVFRQTSGGSAGVTAQVAAFVICALPLVWAGLVEDPDPPSVLRIHWPIPLCQILELFLGRAVRSSCNALQRPWKRRWEPLWRCERWSPFNGHFRNLNWRYLPYIRPTFQAYVREYPTKYGLIWYSTSIL